MDHYSSDTDVVSTRLLDSGRLAAVRFAHPPRNTISSGVLRAIARACASAAATPTVNCLMLHSGIHDYFSDGFSLKSIYRHSIRDRSHPGSAARAWDHGFESLATIAKCQLPVVCVVSGLCQGIGLEIALACDMIFAVRGARIGLHEVALGLVPGLGGRIMLEARIGRGLSDYMLYSGQLMGAEQACHTGLIDAMYPTIAEAVGAATNISARDRADLQRIKAALGRDTAAISAMLATKDEFIASVQSYASSPSGLEP